jgi:hypothetical protein
MGESMSAMTEARDASIPGWDEFAEAVRALPARLLAKLPDSLTHDPQVRQEVARLALEGVASCALGALAADPERPVFVAAIGQLLNVGQPNCDTVYRSADISPDGVYRLRGLRGSLRMFNVAQSPPIPGEPGFKPEPAPRPAHDFNALEVDDQGRFDVIISRERPTAYAGDWWKLEPTTSKLLLRMVSSDWSQEQNPTLAIERLDVPAPRPRVPAARLEAALRVLPAQLNFLTGLLVDHVEQLKREGYVNKLKVFDVHEMGGLIGQFYYEGPYDLADDEALIVETTVPNQCHYRSLILTNGIYETTDWTNNHSSLNDAQAPADADGVLRIVVSAKDPGVPNWLDTAGHPQGLIQGRWFGCDTTPIPSVRKVALSDVRRSLPAETPTISPEAREQVVRERRRAFQERPLW